MCVANESEQAFTQISHNDEPYFVFTFACVREARNQHLLNGALSPRTVACRPEHPREPLERQQDRRSPHGCIRAVPVDQALRIER